MRHGMGEVEKEGSVLVIGDKFEGLFGVGGGQFGLVGIVFEDLFTKHQREWLWESATFGIVASLAGETGIGRPLSGSDHAGIFILRGGHLGMVGPHIVGGGQTVVLIETIAGRQESRIIAEVPFTYVHGGV